MTCTQGEFETITKFKERFENKLKAYKAALGETSTIPESRSAMAFLSKLSKVQYGQYYAFKINDINANPSKVPNTINEVYVEAKSYVII